MTKIKSTMYRSSEFRPNNYSCTYGYLIGSDCHRGFGHICGYSSNFMKYSARLYHRDPILGRSLTGSHTGFGGSHGDWFIRIYSYPQFTAASSITSDCSPTCFYLSGCDPCGFKSLESKFSEGDNIAAARSSFQSSSMLFTKFGSLGVTVDGDEIVSSLMQNRTWKFPTIRLLVFPISLCYQIPKVKHFYALIDKHWTKK